MKFTPKTISILKNFHSINPSLIFNPGNVLRTISPSRSILAQANIDISIPHKFNIHDLSRFMSALSLFEDPELTISENEIVINSGGARLNYVLAADKVMTPPPEKDVDVETNKVCEFNLTNSHLQHLFKAMGVLGLAEVAIIAKGGHLIIKGVDTKKLVKDGFSINLGPTNQTFKVIIDTENLKLMPADYNVKVAKIKSKATDEYINVAKFSSEDVQYLIAVSRESEI